MSIQRPSRLTAELLCTAALSISALTLCATPPARADCTVLCADEVAPTAATGSAATGSASGSASGSATGSARLGPNLTGMGLGLILPLTSITPRAVALMIVPTGEFPSFDQVITHESSWNVVAVNPKTGAYGLGQALPPEKMAGYGLDWRYNAATQIRWAYDYMCERYGSPDGAWAFWQLHHWY
ncbi:lytic transglycosylase domain-containing protein [Nocardia sp. NEAU-G5]|uniref:Lytic transglycosylase domain-containing protein n=1 Tax=Nocardia albiluteola TaxID=2842303 RepID=A0ABS6B912_9NOCA|nr:lytic transglycosylase domain-containing protein [Nocardia albiluteola]MBU3066792.1 lytic transglycosylase domain-containing protein [Nocardia albiluteola]